MTAPTSSWSRITHFGVAVVLALGAPTWSLGAQGSDAPRPRVDSWTLDWGSGTLRMELEAEVAYGSGNDPAAPFRAQRRLEDAMPELMLDLLLTVPIDSRRTIGDAIQVDPGLAQQLTEIAGRADRHVPRPAGDLTTIARGYRVPIYPDMARLFVRHDVPFPLPRVLDWVPTDDFSGVVIYAARPLPFHGTEREVLLTPALLPEIYDTALRPVVQSDMVNPQDLDRWGVLAYTSDPDETPWRGRIGANPLRIMARRVYGIHPTDIMISAVDADRLLSTDHNRQLLRSGRILVIISESAGDGHN